MHSSKATLKPVLQACQKTKFTNSLLSKRLMSTATLSNGAKIPLIGFGTWQDANHMQNATSHALKTGYRHIDGARVYGTEPAVGQAMKDSGVRRDDIFLTTKLWNNSHEPDSVHKACQASLNDLKTDYLDLYLMHWPNAFADGEKMRPVDPDGNVLPGSTPFTETWQAMEELVRKGTVKAIGISNFSLAELQKLLLGARIAPAVHQIERHPYLQQRAFVQFHKDQNIHVTQYSPFGNQNEIYSKGQKMERLINDPTLVEIGKKYSKTGAQVALAWGITEGHSVIPKSKTPERIEENFGGDFKLSTDDINRINSLDRKLRFNDPSTRFRWNFYADLDGKDPENVFKG